MGRIRRRSGSELGGAIDDCECDVKLLAKSRELFSRIGFSYDAAWCLIDMAPHLWRNGQYDDALKNLDVAIETLRGLGFENSAPFGYKATIFNSLHRPHEVVLEMLLEDDACWAIPEVVADALSPCEVAVTVDVN